MYYLTTFFCRDQKMPFEFFVIHISKQYGALKVLPYK